MKLFISLILIPASSIFVNLSRRAQFFCAQILGCIWFDVIRLRRKVAIDNLTVAFPDWPMSKKVSVARKSVQHLCLSFFEYMIIYKYKPEYLNQYFDIHNKKKIDDQLAKGKGALLMTLHMGAIDFALLGFSGFGYKVNATLKKIQNEPIDKFVNELRAKHGIKFIADRRNPFDIFRALKNNETVMFVMDQYMGAPHGIPVKFFGKTAWTAAGLSAFSMKTQMPVIPVYNFRREDGKIEINALDPIELEVIEDREQNIKVMTQKYNDALEKIVRLHPEQWLWIHKRWKS